MIIYHGWNDPALSAYATIQHYEEAMKKDNDLQSYIRLFILPGVLHCGGGTGPDNIDWVKLIEDWTENDKAPERVILSKIQNEKPVMTRPVYPYPRLQFIAAKETRPMRKVLKSKKTENRIVKKEIQQASLPATKSICNKRT